MKRYSKSEQNARNLRYNRFRKNELQLLALDYDVYPGAKNTFMFWFIHEIYGKVIIYPKSNKLQTESGSWHNDANYFLRKFIIKEK